jgi:hypothetical protein
MTTSARGRTDGDADVTYHAEGLRVCLLVQSTVVPQWVTAVAEALLRTGSVELTVAVAGASPPPELPGDRRFAGPLWRLYQMLDVCLQRLLCGGSPDPTAIADLREVGCDIVHEVPANTALVVNLAGHDALRRLAAHPPVPVWWFDHDGEGLWPAVESGYAEVLDGDVTQCRLVGLVPGATSARVLRSARFATHPLFGAENRVQLLWKAIPLLLQKVRELRDSGAVDCEPHDESPAPCPLPRPRGGRVQLILALTSHAWRSTRFVLRRLLWREQWFLLLGDRTGGSTSAFRPVRALIPASDRFWADPHFVPRGEDRLILVEEYLHAQRRGRIALLRLDDRGELVEVRTVLERECHLSYPAVFELAGELYMVPESRELGRIDAYQCTGYPWSWEFAGTLLSDVWACDSSIVQHGGRWWMFATVSTERWLTPRDSMNVYYADDPLRGPWHAHPANPVVCDAYGARPAGQPFVRNDRLYRPSQDCSRGYGYGIRLNEVTTLTEAHFEERAIEFFEPSWPDTVATHTFASGDGTIAVDTMRWLRRYGDRKRADRSGRPGRHPRRGEGGTPQ